MCSCTNGAAAAHIKDFDSRDPSCFASLSSLQEYGHNSKQRLPPLVALEMPMVRNMCEIATLIPGKSVWKDQELGAFETQGPRPSRGIAH